MKTLKLLIVALAMTAFGFESQGQMLTLNWEANTTPGTRIFNVSYDCGANQAYRLEVEQSMDGGVWAGITNFVVYGSGTENFERYFSFMSSVYELRFTLLDTSSWVEIENSRITTAPFTVFGLAYGDWGCDSLEVVAGDVNVWFDSLTYGIGHPYDSLGLTVTVENVDTTVGWTETSELIPLIPGQPNTLSYLIQLPEFGEYKVISRLWYKDGGDFPRWDWSLTDVYYHWGEIITYDASTGLQEQPSNIEGLKVYPNPASDVITIEGLNKDLPIEIRDLTGRLVSTKLLTSSSMNISELLPGIYFLKQSDGRSIRFVKH